MNDIICWIKDLERNKAHFDLMCFQEFPEKKIEHFMSFFKKNDFSSQFAAGFVKRNEIYGQLTIFNTRKLTLTSQKRINLGTSQIENKILKIKAERSSLLTVFETQKKKKLSIANTHLTCVASNKRRIKQLSKIINALLHYISSFFILGDFNYFSLTGKRKLFALMRKNHFQDATHKLKTHHLLFFKHQLDYIFYKDVKIQVIEVKELKFSDHYPILMNFTL